MVKLFTFSLMVFLPIAECLFGIIGDEQSVSVRGKLTCKGQPAVDVLVKLYEDGSIYDSKLGSMKTDGNGTFFISGSHKKERQIEPKINFYHKCNYEGMCSKKVTFHIPQSAVLNATSSSSNSSVSSNLNSTLNSVSSFVSNHTSNLNNNSTNISNNTLTSIANNIPSLNNTLSNTLSNISKTDHTYDIGTIELSAQYEIESTDCIH